VSDPQQHDAMSGTCTLCPACCPVGVVPNGPDLWKPEVPPANAGGACPRGTALTQLLVHRNRILGAAERRDGRLQALSTDAALAGILNAATGAIHVFLEGNLPFEEIAEAARWCAAWEKARLCLVLEPAEQQLLEGLETATATYLSPEELNECDGFLIVGNAFAANPTCCRAIFDRREAESRTPIVVIDPAGGTASKFATHHVATRPGAELAALAALARAADVAEVADVVETGDDMPAASIAAAALANCKRLGVLIAAEFGRTGHWRQAGYLAARLAAAFGGGVAPQTSGANALAAVRLARQVGAISLAEAIADDAAARVVIGCDVRGMLGRPDFSPLAAAAPLPNDSTGAARYVLPVAMPGELNGTYQPPGAPAARVSHVLAAPAGIPTPAGVIAAMAKAAGVSEPGDPPALDGDRRVTVDVAAVRADCPYPNMALLLGRRSGAAGSGALTSHGPWQRAVEPIPPLRVSPADAAKLDIPHLGCVKVTGGERSLTARAMICPQLPAGAVVLPEGLAAARGLLGCEVDVVGGMILSRPQAAALTRENDT